MLAWDVLWEMGACHPLRYFDSMKVLGLDGSMKNHVLVEGYFLCWLC